MVHLVILTPGKACTKYVGILHKEIHFLFPDIIYVYCFYTAAACIQQNLNLHTKLAKFTYNFFLIYIQKVLNLHTKM